MFSSLSLLQRIVYFSEEKDRVTCTTLIPKDDFNLLEPANWHWRRFLSYSQPSKVTQCLGLSDKTLQLLKSCLLFFAPLEGNFLSGQLATDATYIWHEVCWILNQTQKRSYLTCIHSRPCISNSSNLLFTWVNAVAGQFVTKKRELLQSKLSLLSVHCQPHFTQPIQQSRKTLVMFLYALAMNN